MEGAATTVYAQGGRGNSRLVAWEGERTVTFTMEDALISPEGFMLLSGAGLTEASADNKVIAHQTEQTRKVDATPDTIDLDKTNVSVYVSKKPHDANSCYVMLLKDNGDIISEPYIPEEVSSTAESTGSYKGLYKITLKDSDDLNSFEDGCTVLVDYYVEYTSDARQIDITPDKFGGNYYLEASTLFRNQDGVDMPAEFIIPNCKIQSNFTFSMASSGDPSTFTFTMDAFPDYTRWDNTKKVLAAIQIIDPAGAQELSRDKTMSLQTIN